MVFCSECCFWSTFVISILLLIAGIVTLSIVWPLLATLKIQPATCLWNLTKAAHNLTCSTSYLERYVNQTGYKACNETKLDMVVECQRGLQGFGSMCPYPYTKTTNCTDVSENTQEKSLLGLNCYNNNFMKVDVTLGDGQRKEQLEFWTEDYTTSPLTDLNPWECYYYSPKPDRVYWNKQYAEMVAPGQLDGLGWFIGVIFGWVPFGISICLLLVLVPFAIKKFKKTPIEAVKPNEKVLTN